MACSTRRACWRPAAAAGRPWPPPSATPRLPWGGRAGRCGGASPRSGARVSPGIRISSTPSAVGMRVHALHQRVHALEILILRDEQIRLHGQEEMPDILRPVVIEELIADIAGASRARDDAAHDVHQHRYAGAFRPADRQHDAAVERGVRIGGRPALAHRAHSRAELVSPRRAARLILPRAATAGDMSRSNGSSLPDGAARGERAGAEEGLAAAPGRHRPRGIGEDACR